MNRIHRPAPISVSRCALPFRLAALFAIVLAAALAAPAAAGHGEATATPGERLAPLLDGMGEHRFGISSDVPLARRYFEQGLALAYGFNHAEAERSFREAARLDPACAICWWGAALVVGPNINAPMDPAAAPRAWEALTRARELAGRADERERALIAALGARYAADPPADRSALDLAYAEAMRQVATRLSDDVDAQVLFAEALMDTMPWDYWRQDGSPRAATEEVIATLERALELAPGHPGANHFWIHTFEKLHPQRGLDAARRLRHAVPGAGHLVHMPSHIYLNLGMYHEATEANVRAVLADQSYLVQCHAQGLYPVNYASHNHQFLWASATLEGRSELALGAARTMAERIEEHHAEELHGPSAGTAQHFWSTPLFALVRFGRWQEILDRPAPPADLLYPRGLDHYARGIALVRRGRLDAAAGHLEDLQRVIADPGLEGMTFWDMNLLTDLLSVARHVLAGELAAARGDLATAVAELEAGVAAEDALAYDDPPDWHHPVRQILGAVLLDAGRPADAERVYREDLARFPGNGWSLFGLARSLEAQGRGEEAAEAREGFAEAWRHADVELSASRL